MAERILAITCSVLALICAVISVMSFKEKGFLFNNAYIWATKKEREALNKKPHYRQSGVVFAICAAILALMGLECLLMTNWLWLVVGVLSMAGLIYAVASSRNHP